MALDLGHALGVPVRLRRVIRTIPAVAAERILRADLIDAGVASRLVRRAGGQLVAERADVVPAGRRQRRRDRLGWQQRLAGDRQVGMPGGGHDEPVGVGIVGHDLALPDHRKIGRRDAGGQARGRGPRRAEIDDGVQPLDGRARETGTVEVGRRQPLAAARRQTIEQRRRDGGLRRASRRAPGQADGGIRQAAARARSDPSGRDTCRPRPDRCCPRSGRRRPTSRPACGR